jgi:hypothetical protein
VRAAAALTAATSLPRKSARSPLQVRTDAWSPIALAIAIASLIPAYAQKSSPVMWPLIASLSARSAAGIRPIGSAARARWNHAIARLTLG